MSRRKALAGALALATVAGMGAAYLALLAPEARAPVTLHDPEDQAPASALISNLDPTGRWAVREGSEAGYRIREKLARLPAPSDAVGRTTGVTGDLMLTGDNGRYTVSDISVEVDMSRLASDSSRRDRTLRERGLETDRYPTATFVGPGPIQLPTEIRSGQPVEFMLDGALTIHGVTRHVSIPVEGRLEGRTAEVVGSLTIFLADFGIEPPNIANIVTVEPTGTLEFRLLLEKAV